MVDFKTYIARTDETAVYPDKLPSDCDPNLIGLIYVMLKLPGECAEVSQHIGKVIRDDNCIITSERIAAIKKEVGDVFWYLARLCKHLGIDPDEFLQENLDKLSDRKARGTIKGSGDNR